eukprot:524484-Pleurochrysis_carterae.AAC.1
MARTGHCASGSTPSPKRPCTARWMRACRFQKSDACVQVSSYVLTHQKAHSCGRTTGYMANQMFPHFLPSSRPPSLAHTREVFHRSVDRKGGTPLSAASFVGLRRCADGHVCDVDAACR